MFKKVESHPDFPKIEEEILKFWQEQDIFQKSLDKNKKENYIPFLIILLLIFTLIYFDNFSYYFKKLA